MSGSYSALWVAIRGKVMNQPVSNELHNMAAGGMQALQNGNGAKARDLLAKAAPHWPDASIWVALAHACHMCEDQPARLEALLTGEQRDPANIRLRVALGDYYHDAREARAAQAQYMGALQLASREQSLSPALRPELDRAQQRVQANAAQYEEKLMAALGDDFDRETAQNRRFAQSLDILLGKKNIYLQEPTQYYFPGLPQIQFYEREQFSWIPALEAKTGEIRDELQNILREGGGFEPYLGGQDDVPVLNYDSLVDNPDWGAYYFWKDGQEVPGNMARCPRTTAALREIQDLYFVADFLPSILFSRLKPHTRIPPHNGLMNTRLIAHLPLIVPPGCGFRVGNEIRQWEEGKMLIFDDSMDHEAWNDSDQTRVILLMEIHRPELSDGERQLVDRLLREINRQKH